MSNSDSYSNSNNETSFCLLKPETYWFGKKSRIEQYIADSGLTIVAKHQVKLSFKDILNLYPGRMARITMTLRMPYLMQLDLYIIEGPQAISRMHQLKFQIRHKMMGLKMGGFVHAPDSPEELDKHMAILSAAKSNSAYQHQR